MRNPSSIDFSLILPSRGRPERLRIMLESFYRLARRPQHVEAIILCDFDDPSAARFDEYLDPAFNGRVIFGRQAELMIHDYNNFGAQCATGRYLWQLNDDYEMLTEGWDTIIGDAIERFLVDKRDRVIYVQIDDSTHTNWERADEWGCCCPILTVETVDAMNANMPQEVQMWGADIWLWKIFQQLAREHERRISLINEVKVKHHCRHNGTAPLDAQANRVAAISKKMFLHQHEVDGYLQLLQDHIHAFRMV